MRYKNPGTAAIRKTLDLLPDEIALAIGLRVFDLESRESCVCGWAIREAIAREVNVDPEDVQRWVFENGWTNTNAVLAERFGGTVVEWNEIFSGVTDHHRAPLVEEALFDRVMAAALKS